ncbi:uncharacterized protein LOC142345661 isoform X2 [Convolutriloba macropyga]|uniref:uncharacterized protein LOC142345661 isoform X2 n=1 Tax=Convolutriloba macropyga TaxID=536237 RepID=UPI003F5205F0
MERELDFSAAICLGCMTCNFQNASEVYLTNCLHIYCKPCSGKLMKYGCVMCKNKESVKVQSLTKLGSDYLLMFATQEKADKMLNDYIASVEQTQSDLIEGHRLTIKNLKETYEGKMKKAEKSWSVKEKGYLKKIQDVECEKEKLRKEFNLLRREQMNQSRNSSRSGNQAYRKMGMVNQNTMETRSEREVVREKINMVVDIQNGSDVSNSPADHKRKSKQEHFHLEQFRYDKKSKAKPDYNISESVTVERNDGARMLMHGQELVNDGDFRSPRSVFHSLKKAQGKIGSNK